MPRPKLVTPNYRLQLRGTIWRICWTDPASGVTRSISTRETDRQRAEIWLEQYKAGLAHPEPPPEPTINDIIDHYLEERRGHVAAFDTLEWAAIALRHHVGKLQSRMLSRRLYMTKRLASGVSPGTVIREIVTLRAALHLAERDGWIKEAPYIEAPPKPPPRDRWLSREELAQLIANAGAPHTRLFIVLAYHTAARAGAILDLTWDRVDFERRLITYDRPGRTVNKKRRAIVPINTPALVDLQAARLVATGPHVLEFRGLPVRSIKTGFNAAVRRAGIEDCSPHILRHTAATHLVMAGVPLSEIARLLGDTEAMVEKTYGKHAPDYLRRAADALAGVTGPHIVSESLDSVTQTRQGIPRLSGVSGKARRGT